MLTFYTGVVESQLRTCYFGPPPEPLPGEHWMQAATREIRKRCPGTQISTGTNNGQSGQEASMSMEPKATTDQPTTEQSISTVKPTEQDDNDGTTPSIMTTASSPRYADCRDSYANGIYGGVVTIYPTQYPDGLEVSCNEQWIVIQRRNVAAENFTRSWAEYRDGFGNLGYSFWLGNEIVRQLTSDGNWELKVGLNSLDDPGSSQTVQFDDFQIVGDEYQLVASLNPSFPLGHSLTDVHTGQPFSTYDHDNDDEGNDTNCAALLKGGWWFKTCTGGVDTEDLVPSNLNGEFSYPVNYTGQDYRGMRWAGAFDGPIRPCEILIRRNHCCGITVDKPDY
ncbi:ficolin-3-like [Patiria miniata]|uniref:Fibrinogen C-terminal domain-containing protein n=1 Tax=Patiria miniata TaxID=46514 RepID=A0A913ZZQ2_PATMI|nr:ficolin-3-like [Patiria miniata]